MMERLIFDIVASITNPLEIGKFVSFHPAITLFSHGKQVQKNMDDFLNKVESLVNNLNLNKMNYVIEPAEKEDFYNEGRGKEIYATASPEVDVLVIGDDLKDVLGSIQDQMSNISKKQTDGDASFNIVPFIQYNIDGRDLKINISYEIDQDSVKFN